MLLSQKAAEAEQEITRIRLSAMRTEEEKVMIERKILIFTAQRSFPGNFRKENERGRNVNGEVSGGIGTEGCGS